MVILEILVKSYRVSFAIKLFHLKAMTVLMELFGGLLMYFMANELENFKQKLKFTYFDALQEK